MRNPDRLDNFYSQLCKIHKKSFPDIRFGQLMCNFISWLSYEKKIDVFFPEENKLLDLFKQYANSNSMLYQGWDVLERGKDGRSN